MENKKRKILIAAILVVTTISTWWFATRNSEPILSGKPVSFWINHMPSGTDGFLEAGHPLEEAGPEIIPYLIDAVESKHGFNDMINKLASYSKRHLKKDLIERRAPGRTIRTFAAFRLGQFGAAASNAVPALIVLLEKPNEYPAGRDRVIQAIGNIGPPAKQAIPTLVKILPELSGSVGGYTANALMQIGVVPQESIPDLEKLLKEKGYISGYGAVAIWAANPTQKSLARINNFLSSKSDYMTRAHTARSLAFVKKIPDKTIVTLLSMLNETDSKPNVRQGAAIALAYLESSDIQKIISVLIEGVQNGEFQIPCARALGHLSPPAESGLPILEEVSKKHSSVRRRACLQAIQMIKSELSP